MTTMTAQTDEELALSARNGSRDAESALVQRYWTVAGAIARTFPVNGHDLEDVLSVAYMGALKAVRTYEDGKGSKFSTWVRQIIGRDLIDFYRKANKLSEIPLGMLANLNDVLSLDGGDEVSLEDAVPNDAKHIDTLTDQVECSDMVEKIQRAIWPPFRDFINGFSAAEIAHRQNLPSEAVDMVLACIRSITKSHLSVQLNADLIGLLESRDHQPVLEMVPTRDSEAGSVIAFEVYREFYDVQKGVLEDLGLGCTYAEIAEHNRLTEETVARLIATIRAVMTGVLPEAA